MGDTELYFHNVTSLVFKMLGFYTNVERHTTDERMDMLVQTKDYIYIFEFKIDKSADAALRQIEEKQYAKPFETDPRKLYKKSRCELLQHDAPHRGMEGGSLTRLYISLVSHVIPPLRLNRDDMVVGRNHLGNTDILGHISDDCHIRR